MRKLSFLLTLLAVLSTSVAFAQTRTVTGQVVDASNGSPMAGVFVSVQGTNMGMPTDENGRFSLQADAASTLEFNYLGMTAAPVVIGGRTEVVVEMTPAAESLDDVVVVGYGTVKKASLTGSVASVSYSKLENRAAPSLSSALAGLAVGVSVRQGSGNPGDDAAKINVRGVGTFSGDYGGPMVLVDGVESDMNSINTDDVESISILKDASSAAIYGSRGANGVILVTTKKGKAGAKPSITYSTMLSQQQPSARHEFLYDYAEHMTLHNQASYSTNPTSSLPYMQEEIDEWRAAKSDPNGESKYGVPNFLAYPNTDWAQEIFTNRFSQNHNLSITGGTDNTTYLLSLGYMTNPGVVENTGLDRINARINIETRINKFLIVGTQTSLMRQDKAVGNWGGVQTYFFMTPGGIISRYDGKFGGAQAIGDRPTTDNMLSIINSRDGNQRTHRINTTWYARATIMEGLTLEGRYNYQPRLYNEESWPKNNAQYNFRTGVVVKPGPNATTATTSRRSSEEYTNTANLLLNYVKSFGDHNISGLLGYEQYSYTYKGFSASKRGLIDLSIHDISSASEMQSIDGEYERGYAMISWFGRVNYDYKGKYLFEANFRRDGSSRFAPESRWGTFPSFSAAWRISDEPFFQGAKKIVDDLKIRASWGQLGNVTSGYYDWQANYATQINSMGGAVANGLAVGKIANNMLHWENVNSTEIGIDAWFLRSRLGLEVNLYNRQTKGILTSPGIYATMGMATPPTRNTADMRNRGIEVVLGWNDRAGEFSYGASVNLAYNSNKVTKYLGKLVEGMDNGIPFSNIGQTATWTDDTNRSIVTEGHKYGEFFVRSVYKGDGSYFNGDGSVNVNGGPRDGMIRTKADYEWAQAMIDAGYTFNGSSTVGTATSLSYGELVMSDVNGDGNYGNTYDRKFSGKSDIPEYTVGFTANASWRGIDLNMTWAGNFGMWYYLRQEGINKNNFNSREYVLPRNAREMFYFYDESNPSNPLNNINAEYPRMLYGPTNDGAYLDSDFWLYDASYFKLKFLQVGYTFPARWTEKIAISKLRVFFSGENLLTITKYPGMDPEIGGRADVYPLARVISGGINITF